MAFYKSCLSVAASVAEVVKTEDVQPVRAGEVYVGNSIAGSDEILVLALEDAVDGVFKGSLLHGSKKGTMDRIRKMGTTQLYCLAQSDEEVTDEEPVGLALWHRVAESGEALSYGQLAWVTRTRKAQVTERLGSLRAAMTARDKV